MMGGFGAISGGGLSSIGKRSCIGIYWGVIDVVLIIKEEDSWSHVNGGVYTISSNYSFLYQKFHPSSPSLVLAPIHVIAQVWESWAPSKVIVLASSTWEAFNKS
ncbi:hypothetical protein A2U01_0005345 [Trifolium medium]|uniref:Uncharacterized protein n=1 Tax=Trifolium medium TaxID=97028 RepID=A0A392MBI6_9FABA|nr:hypothetical protein [Trifolium medium]